MMNFQRDVVEKSRDIPVLVQFWMENCGPCKTLKPILADNHSKRPHDYELIEVNIREHPELGRKYTIQSVPVLLLFNIGQMISRVNGFIPGKNLNEWLDRELPVEYLEVK